VPRRRPAHRFLPALLALTASIAGSAGPARAGLLGIGFQDFKLYDLNTATAAPSNPRTAGNKINMIAFSPTGTLYGVSQGYPNDSPPAGRLFTINVGTGAATLIATLDKFVVTEGDIACDPTSGILYAVDGAGELFTINTTTGAGTTVGVIPGNVDLSAMAFDATGNLYIVDTFGPTLLKVNKVNGAVTGSVPLGPVDIQIAGLAFDPQTGTLYYSGGYPTSKLYTVNTTTGVATLVGTKSITGGVGGLAFVPLEISAGFTKDFTNTTSSVADGVDITLQGVYTSVMAHFDGYPAHHFTSFSVVPAGQNTILRWSGGTTIPVNDKVHLGFFVLGSQYQLVSGLWKSGAGAVGLIDQINTRPHLTSAPSPALTISNTLSAGLQGALYAGNLTIEYSDHAVAIDSLVAGLDRHPIRTDVFPVPALYIAPGDSVAVPAGAPPAGATHAIVTLSVGPTPNPSDPAATTDVIEVPLRPEVAVPGLGPWGMLLAGALLAGASGWVIARRRAREASTQKA
jgi:hypothetical protein